MKPKQGVIMEDEKIETPQAETASQDIVSLNQQHLEPKIAKKIQEINSFYQKSFNNYQKNIQEYNSKITNIKDTIRFENKKNMQDKEAFTEAKNELHQEERSLDYLQNKLNQKIKSLEEFKQDNEENTKTSTYLKKFSKRKDELIELLEEVEESELALLNKELQRLNLLETLEPKLENIMKLENNLNILEKEKENFERIGFNEITQIAQKEETKSIVDTVVM